MIPLNIFDITSIRHISTNRKIKVRKVHKVFATQDHIIMFLLLIFSVLLLLQIIFLQEEVRALSNAIVDLLNIAYRYLHPIVYKKEQLWI